MFGFGKKTLASVSKSRTSLELRSRVRILVIDDEEDAFPIATLKAEGYNIDYWSDVTRLDQLERGDFHIIVLDIAGIARDIAADDEGLGVLQHLKARNPTQIIVAFSGQAFDLSKQVFFKLADDTMPKPVSALKCKEVLDQLIETRLSVQHMWGTMAAIMRAEGIPERKIAELETGIAVAVSRQGKSNHVEIIERLIERTELATKVASTVSNICSIWIT